MKGDTQLTHEFVEYIPDVLQEQTIYISIPYATATHKCCCGCGNEVVTPFSPTDWALTFDGKTISLYPSIGNWSLECRSHYWIRHNRVKWAEAWSRSEIEKGRKHDWAAKEEYFASAENSPLPEIPVDVSEGTFRPTTNTIWQRLRNWWTSI
jgi:hypothetical protein